MVDSNYAGRTLYQNNIIFQPVPDKLKTDAPFSFIAQSLSGKEPLFTVESGNVSVNYGVATIQDTGVVVVKAYLPPDAYFDSAVVTTIFKVNAGGIYSFTGNGNCSTTSNWLNNTVPPIFCCLPDQK